MKARIVLSDGVVIEADGTPAEIAELTDALRRSHEAARPGGDDADAPSDLMQPGHIEPDEPLGLNEPGDEEAPEPTGEDGEPAQWGLEVDEEDGVEPDESDARLEEVDDPTGVTTPTHGPPLDLIVREVADQFRLLADSTRLQILSRLIDRGHNVGELCEALGGMSQPAVSHHLALLRVSGLVTPSREGKFNFYDLTDQGRTLTEAVGRLGTSNEAGATALFRQASDTTRLQILATLSEGDRNVGELCSDLGGMSQPAVSHHLTLLRHGGLVEARRAGKFSFYSLREEGRELTRLVAPMLAARARAGPAPEGDTPESPAFDFSSIDDDWMDGTPHPDCEPGEGDEGSPGGAPPAHLLCRRVLLMVQELHRRGYERLRVAPGLSRSGLHWGCSIVPASDVRPGHGAIVIDEGGVAARYDSAHGAGFFGWDDAENDPPSALASKFLERFPDLKLRGEGGDPEYARWYARMLRATDPDGLIYAQAGWDVPGDHLPALGCTADVKIPLPPPGGACSGC
ncbi:MAG: hypothetical protein BGO49_07100 [Planctomycetales bacterium 71-10]|nr:MAG: hypothetical protein BGO49_07100 [Planctomycetales bacterium 71-10]